jgi:nucleotide-binding universal stress UspA family protein
LLTGIIGNERMMAIERIVVGVDGTQGSQHAAAWAASMAASVNARVVAVHVVARTWLMELSAMQLDTDRLVKEFRAKFLGPWTESFRRASVHYTCEFLSGDPASELLRVAHERHADLVVIGGTHHSGFREALLGGTAHRVVNRCRIPITIVPLEVPVHPARHVPLPG